MLHGFAYLRPSVVGNFLCVPCDLLRLFCLGPSFALFVPFCGYSRFLLELLQLLGLLELLLLLIFAHLREPIVGE